MVSNAYRTFSVNKTNIYSVANIPVRRKYATSKTNFTRYTRQQAKRHCFTHCIDRSVHIASHTLQFFCCTQSCHIAAVPDHETWQISKINFPTVSLAQQIAVNFPIFLSNTSDKSKLNFLALYMLRDYYSL